MVFSRKKIEIIGAISGLPGAINHMDPKIEKNIGVYKNFKKMLLNNFVNVALNTNKIK